MSSEAAQKAYPVRGGEIAEDFDAYAREAFDAGARHALEEAAGDALERYSPHVSDAAAQDMRAWLRARALAVGDNRNQENQ